MNMYIAEFIGTMVLIILGNGVVANVVLAKTKGNNGGWIVITTGWCFAVMIAAAITGRVSGAHLNPAVTVAQAVNGVLAWNLVAGYIVSQMLGAILGACFVWLFYKEHFAVETDADAKLGCFATGANIKSPINNFLSEVIATCIFVMAILGITHPNSGFGPVGTYMVASAVWGVGLSLGGTTGYAINPARDLGPRIAHTFLPIPGKRDSDWSYAWIPVLGPIVGGVLAVFIFNLMG